MLSSIIIILFGIVTAVHLVSCGTPYPRLKAITKVMLMPLLLTFYLLTSQNISSFVVLGLVCSTMGDTFLLITSKSFFFLAGASAFGLAHIFYTIQISGYLVGMKPNLFVWAIAALVVTALCIVIYLRIRASLPKNLRALSMIYAALIGMMSCASALRLVSDFNILSVVGMFGAILFVISDTVLIKNLFVDENREQTDFIVMATYITAQSMLISSFMF